MPATTLWITEDDVDIRLMFITQMFGENDMGLNIYVCNEDFIPQGDPVSRSLNAEESDYHKQLRSDSVKKGHYVPAHSTNPEWNPDYVEPTEEAGGHYGC